MVVKQKAIRIPRGIVIFGFLTSSTTLTISSNPIKAKKARNEPKKIPIHETPSKVGISSGSFSGKVRKDPEATKIMINNPAISIIVKTIAAPADSLIPQQANKPNKNIVAAIINQLGIWKKIWK